MSKKYTCTYCGKDFIVNKMKTKNICKNCIPLFNIDMLALDIETTINDIIFNNNENKEEIKHIKNVILDELKKLQNYL